jgi:hypothetical protein
MWAGNGDGRINLTATPRREGTSVPSPVKAAAKRGVYGPGWGYIPVNDRVRQSAVAALFRRV